MAIATNDFPLQCAIQDDKATEATAPVYAFEVIDGGLGSRPQVDTLNVCDNGIWVPSHKRIGYAETGGSPVVTANPNSLGALLVGALGADSVTGSGDPYTHVITPATDIDEFPWFTFWQCFGDQWEAFPACAIVGLDIECSIQNKYMRVTPQIIGTKRQKTHATVTPVASEDVLFHWLDATGTWKLNSAAEASVRSFRFSVGMNAAALQGEDVTAYTVQRKRGSINVAIEVLVEDLDTLNLIKYGSTSPSAETEILDTISQGAIEVEFTADDDPERSIKFEIDEFDYDPEPAYAVTGNPAGDEVYLTVGGEATGDPTGATPICTITLLNSEDDYLPGS
jgi:hypothetical protein